MLILAPCVAEFAIDSGMRDLTKINTAAEEYAQQFPAVIQSEIAQAFRAGAALYSKTVRQSLTDIYGKAAQLRRRRPDSEAEKCQEIGESNG